MLTAQIYINISYFSHGVAKLPSQKLTLLFNQRRELYLQLFVKPLNWLLFPLDDSSVELVAGDICMSLAEARWGTS